MEVIGLVASVISIAAGVLEGVRIVKAYYQAPVELETLQSHVEHLSLLVEEISRRNLVSSSIAIATILPTAKHKLKRMDQLIQTKLIKNVHGTSRVRGRVWARNKSKIYRMQVEIQECRANLIAAMTGCNLSSAIDSDAALESISQSLSHSQQFTSRLDQNLLEIQQAVTRIHNVVMSQPIIANGLLQSTSSDALHRAMVIEQPTPLPSSSSQRYDPAAAETNPDSRKRQILPTKDMTGLSEFLRRQPSILGPTDPFNSSFPETYSIDQRFPIDSLVIISSREQSSSVDCRTILCRAYLRKSPRKWRELVLVLQICRSSIYWAATKVSRKQVQIKQMTTSSRSLQLPDSLQQRIQATLSQAKKSAEEIDLKYHIFDQVPVHSPYDEIPCHRYSGTTNSLTSNCENPMAFLNDLGCDQYLEDEVVQLEMLDPQIVSLLVSMVPWSTK